MKKHESGGFIHSDDGKVGDEDTHTENYNILWDVPWRDSLEASVGSNLLSLGGWVEEGLGSYSTLNHLHLFSLTSNQQTPHPIDATLITFLLFPLPWTSSGLHSPESLQYT